MNIINQSVIDCEVDIHYAEWPGGNICMGRCLLVEGKCLLCIKKLFYFPVSSHGLNLVSGVYSLSVL
jgi:hypothetical protein